MVAAPEGSRPPLPGWLMLVHLLVLAAFAVVQPTLSVLSDSIQFFFPARRVEGGLFVLTLALFTVLPPLILWLVGVVGGRVRPALRWPLHLAAVWLFAALFAAYVSRELDLGLLITIIVSLGGATLFLNLYGSREPVRSALSMLGPVPIVFLLYFLAFTDASHLVTRDDPDVPAAHSTRPRPVVVHVLDELPIVSMMGPDGRIDRARFPNIASLADDATWYRTALADAWTTFEAVPAILTGRHQSRGELPVAFAHPENLFTLLRQDYDERVVESFTRLCPLSTCPNESSGLRRVRSLVEALVLTYGAVVAPKLERRLPTPGNTFSAVLAALEPKEKVDADDFETADLRLFPGPQFDRFLEGVRRPAPGSRKAPLYFLHSNLPHNPWNHLPDGRLYRDHSKREHGLNVSTEEWDNHVGATLHGWQRHLLQAQFADRLVGRLLRRLRREGIYDKATVVLLADHGVSFVPGLNRRKPRSGNLSNVAMVPLFVKTPGQSRGRIEDGPVSTIDVLPTIAEQTGTRVPWRIDGEPLAVAARNSRRTLSILLPGGGRQPLAPAPLRRQRRAFLRYQAARFGSGRGGPGLYGIGPARTLQGERLAAVPRGERLAARARLRDSEDYDDVNLSGPFVPALVRGTLSRPPPRLRSVAVAVNGRVMGSGYLYGDLFELMVDPSAFRDGKNEIEVLGVAAGKAGVRLHELSG